MRVSRRVATSQWKEQWTVLKLAETKILGNTGNADDNTQAFGRSLDVRRTASANATVLLGTMLLSAEG